MNFYNSNYWRELFTTCDILMSHSFILRIVCLLSLLFCSCTCTVILSSCSVKYTTRQHTSLISSKCICSYCFFVPGCYIGADIDSIHQVKYEAFSDNGVLVCSRYCKWAGMSNPGDFILLSV